MVPSDHQPSFHAGWIARALRYDASAASSRPASRAASASRDSAAKSGALVGRDCAVSAVGAATAGSATAIAAGAMTVGAITARAIRPSAPERDTLPILVARTEESPADEG